jgi:hypothetical protein
MVTGGFRGRKLQRNIREKLASFVERKSEERVVKVERE